MCAQRPAVIDIVQLRRELKIVLFKGDTWPIAGDEMDDITSAIFAVF